MDHYNDSDIDFSDIDFDLAYTDIDCLICGHSIGYVDGLSHNPLLSGKRGLKASKPLACFPEKGSKRVAYCSAAKLEEMDLGEDGTRICLYRLSGLSRAARTASCLQSYQLYLSYCRARRKAALSFGHCPNGRLASARIRCP